jgi:hypothetical protein
MNIHALNKILCLAAGLLALGLDTSLSQPYPPGGNPANVPFQQRLNAMVAAAQPDANVKSNLTRLSLDFPGGTPKQLVAAIEKATGKPLNVIIADEDAGTKLPPIKMSDQDVATLFQTLDDNSKKYSGNEMVRDYGFKTIDTRPSDNSLWTFYAYSKPVLETQFSLGFPGGTPSQLVKAIEKAMNKPLNVIINPEDENIELPAIKMNDVYLPQLFTALEATSQKRVTISNGLGNSYSTMFTSYGFKTSDGRPTDTSVWYFHVDKPGQPPIVSVPKVCQFYPLSDYLNRGFTVDDITTAVQTGWKLAGQKSPPELNYHKETSLLIAYGEPELLKSIDQVLQALPSENPSRTRQKMDKAQGEILQLQRQVEQLKVHPVAPTNGVADEKTGK